MSDIRSSITDLLGQVERLLHNLAFAKGLNPAQWSALRYLSTAADGDRTVTAFARHHRTTKPAASKTIDALVRKAMVKKTSIPGDRRAQRLDLTAKAIRRIGQDPRNLLRSAVGTLDKSDMAALSRSLVAITTGIGAHVDGGGVPRSKPARRGRQPAVRR